MNNPVSAAIVTPFYNESLYIRPMLKSLAGQSNDSRLTWTAVFVDNGSTDDTTNIIKQFCRSHHINALIVKERRQGTAYSRVTGLRVAAKLEPEILISTDADTILPPTFVRNTYADMQNAEALCGKRKKSAKVDLWKRMKSEKIFNAHRAIWNLEFSLFGPYFFGAYFAIRTDLFKKLPILPPRAYSQYMGEDVHIARRAHFLNARIHTSTIAVTPDPRRVISTQEKGLGSFVGNATEPHAATFRTDALDFSPLPKQTEAKILNGIIDFSTRRLLWSIADAYVFWHETGTIYTNAKKCTEKGLAFFSASLTWKEPGVPVRKNIYNLLLRQSLQSGIQHISRYIYEQKS